MKESTLKNAKSIVFRSSNENSIIGSSKRPDKQDIKNIFRCIAVNFLCFSCGLLPIITTPLWKVFKHSANFISEFLACPDLIFVGIALWVAFIGTVVFNKTELGKINTMANAVGVMIGVIVFVVEVIAREENVLGNAIEFVKVFNAAFCVSQFIIHTTSMIVVNYREREKK